MYSTGTGRTVGLVLWMLLVSLAPASSSFQEGRPSRQPEQALLKDILRKTGEYCARLERISLYFVCVEEIEERIFNPYRSLEWSARMWETEENTYLYDYQLIRKEKIEESRILLKMNGKQLDPQRAPLRTKRFTYRNVIFGPIGIFGFEAQERHYYSVEKETKLGGIRALVMKAVPKNPEEVNWLYGKAWVDMADGSILKAEWEEKSVGNYDAMLEFAESIHARPALKQESEYGIEKNGIRFPSQYKVTEDYHQRRTVGIGVRIVTKSTLAVKYKDYKFFIVETETTIKK